MMNQFEKRILSFIFALLFIAQLVPSAWAAVYFSDSFSVADLSAYGIRRIRASRVSQAPVTDGILEEKEYESSAPVPELSLGNGLFLVSSNGDKEITPQAAFPAGITVAPFVRYDSAYFYIALQVKFPSGTSVPQIARERAGRQHLVQILLGLSQHTDAAAAQSRLLNAYYFDPQSKNCTYVIGERVSVRMGQLPVSALRISNLYEERRNEGFVDDAGIRWTADYYCSQAALSAQLAANGETTMVFEARIPVGDALLSVPEEERGAVLGKIQKEDECFLGSFSFRIPAIDGLEQNAVYLSNARAAGDVTVFPLSGGEGTDFASAYLADFPAELGANVVNFLPSPIFFSQNGDFELPPSPATPKASDPASPADGTADPSGPAPPSTTAASSAVAPSADAPSETPSDAASGNDRITEAEQNDSSSDPWLPENLIPPESTERIELEKEDSGFALREWIFLIVGILMLLAIVAFYFVLRQSEKIQKEKERNQTEGDKIPAAAGKPASSEKAKLRKRSRK